MRKKEIDAIVRRRESAIAIIMWERRTSEKIRVFFFLLCDTIMDGLNL